MAKNNNLTDFLTDVANAIRTKKGTSALIDPQDFSDEIDSIRGGTIGYEVQSVDNGDGTQTLQITDGDEKLSGEFTVEFRDIDGTLLKTAYADSGDSVTPPANPTFDSDYLEFDYWAVSGGDSLSNITRDTLVMPQYKTKLNTTLNERPTYLFCYFDTNLTPELYFYNYTDANIDWGDGSTAEQVAAQTISHTYAAAGLYVIKIYGSNYSVGGNTTAGIFTNTTYSKCALKLYFGQNQKNLRQYNCYSCTSLMNIVMPSGVSSIGNYAFGVCSSLTNIVIPSNITSLGTYVFSGCIALQHAIILNTITSFPQNLFAGCYNLESFVIPNNVSSANNSIFSNCYGLKSVIISNNMTTIPNNMFSNCASLEKVSIPNNITTINNAFGYTYSLENLFIPSSVTTVSGDPFFYAYGLRELTLGDNFNAGGLTFHNSPLSKNSFINIANKLKDNTGATAKTITFNQSSHFNIMNTVYLDSNGSEVAYGTTGAVSLLAFIQNKNWTVSFRT